MRTEAGSAAAAWRMADGAPRISRRVRAPRAVRGAFRRKALAASRTARHSASMPRR